MKKVLVILFLLWLGFPWEGKAQDDVYRMELGGGVGGCFYLGDANSKPFAHLGAMGSVVARYIFNPRMAIKGNLAFWGYGIGRGYEGYSRITPYMLIGAGLTLAPKPVQTDAGFNIPVGVGVKFKVRPRLNIGFEWSMRFTTTDRLDVSNMDGVILHDPYGVKSGGFKNKDCYSFTMLSVTYDLFPKCVNCNNIKYVF